MSVVKQVAKWSGGCIAGALILGKVVSPYLSQLQKCRTEEAITDESVVRRFEQCLREGEVRFNEDITFIQEIINNYFNVESMVERIRTSRPEDKKALWQDLKLIVTARLLSTIYATHILFVLSRAQMILIGKKFSRTGPVKDEEIFTACRNFMDEMKGLMSVMVSQLCTLSFEACKDVLLTTSLDTKIEDVDSIKNILYQLKQRTDAVFSVKAILDKFYSSQVRPSLMLKELCLYTKSRNFNVLLDHLICDGLDIMADSGIESIQSKGQAQILLNWVTFFSTVFAQDQITQILLQKWIKGNKIFSHLAVLYCENFNN